MDEVCIGPSEEVPEGVVRVYEVGGREIGVLRVHGRLRAYENRCPHQSGPVCLGELIGRQEAVLDQQKRVVGERLSDEHIDLICPWHGYSFDALTGECIGDRRLRLRPWSAVERGGQIFVSGRAR